MTNIVSQISELCITFNTREYIANINPHPELQDSGQKKEHTFNYSFLTTFQQPNFFILEKKLVYVWKYYTKSVS